MRPTHLPRVMLASEFDQIEEDITTALDNFFSGQRPLFSLSERIWSPPTDVYEAGGTIHVKMEIAGVREEDLDIAVDKNLVRVRGRRLEDAGAQRHATYHLMEIRYGSFERVFGLPAKIDVDKVSATYRDGFLLIAIPKQRTQPREIHIEVE